MPNTFYLDEHLMNPVLIAVARELGALVITPRDTGCLAEDDPAVAQYAIEQGYVLVTANRDDLVKEFRNRLKQDEHHPGVVFVTAESARDFVWVGEALGVMAYDDLTDREEWI